MTTVIIRPDNGQADSMKALLADVTKASKGEPVRLGFGGVVLSVEAARRYLNSAASRPDSPVATDGVTVDNTREPMPTRRTADTDTSPDGKGAAEGREFGGLTPDGQLPGGYAGIAADQRTTAPAVLPDGNGDDATSGAVADSPTRQTAEPVKKATPAKKTAAAAQRANRSTRS